MQDMHDMLAIHVHAFISALLQSFVEALQWVMLYYSIGVPSWGWFYPFHYAPMTSDLSSITHMGVAFVKGI